MIRSHLFSRGAYTLHSGIQADWIIDCEELTDEAWHWAAYEVAKRVRFSDVVGIPNGGLKFAEACRIYRRVYRSPYLLIVDDVLTTGQSMEEFKERFEPPYIGFVLFDRTGYTKTSTWINALWQFADIPA